MSLVLQVNPIIPFHENETFQLNISFTIGIETSTANKADITNVSGFFNH